MRSEEEKQAQGQIQMALKVLRGLPWPLVCDGDFREEILWALLLH